MRASHPETSMRTRFVLAALMTGGVAHAQQPAFERIQWLTGCWEIAGAARRTVEVWQAPSRGMMMGGSFSVTDTSSRENEQLRLFFVGDTLVYEAHPSSQARTPFKATTVAPGNLVFENPGHDFPQKISYRRSGTDSLIARIEGDRLGRRAPLTFAFKRAACGNVAVSRSAVARATLQPLYEEMAAREVRQASGRVEWLVEHAVPGYSYVIWSAPGSSVTTFDIPALRQTIQRSRASTGSHPADMRYAATVDRVLARGDTVEALVVATMAWTFVDDAGRLGGAGQRHQRGIVQRAVDKWIVQHDRWLLLSTTVVHEEVSLDGNTVVVNGRAVARAP